MTNYPLARYLLIPLDWITFPLILLSILGCILGLISIVSPQSSIGLYQWMMRCFKWRVEPMFPDREIRNTRFLGLAMVILCLILFSICVTNKLFQ